MQPRRIIGGLAMALSLALVATLVSAQQVYKWKDANGVTHFSQTPPASGVHYTRMHLEGEPAVASNPPATDTSAGTAASDQGAASSTVPDNAENRAKLCGQLASNIALLESNRSLTKAGPNGVQEQLGETERSQQLATARAQQSQYCGGQ
jgi:Domain of unknown function (DUF4124)